MNKILLAFKSRTFWTVVVLFVINGITGIRALIPPAWLPFVDGLLALLIAYFHVNPSQTYN